MNITLNLLLGIMLTISPTSNFAGTTIELEGLHPGDLKGKANPLVKIADDHFLLAGMERIFLFGKDGSQKAQTDIETLVGTPTQGRHIINVIPIPGKNTVCVIVSAPNQSEDIFLTDLELNKRGVALDLENLPGRYRNLYNLHALPDGRLFAQYTLNKDAGLDILFQEVELMPKEDDAWVMSFVGIPVYQRFFKANSLFHRSQDAFLMQDEFSSDLYLVFNVDPKIVVISSAESNKQALEIENQTSDLIPLEAANFKAVDPTVIGAKTDSRLLGIEKTEAGYVLAYKPDRKQKETLLQSFNRQGTASKQGAHQIEHSKDAVFTFFYEQQAWFLENGGQAYVLKSFE